jgi:hypothetical protein
MHHTRQTEAQSIISIAHLAGCTISSVLTSLVTDFKSTSDGRTRESSFNPKLQRQKQKKRRRISPGTQAPSIISPFFPNPRSPNPSQSLNPRAAHLWIRLFIDPSGALPNPIHARFICASEPIRQKTPPKPKCRRRRGANRRAWGSEQAPCPRRSRRRTRPSPARCVLWW